MNDYLTVKVLAEGGQGVATLATNKDGEKVVIKSVVCDTLKSANFALSEVMHLQNLASSLPGLHFSRLCT